MSEDNEDNPMMMEAMVKPNPGADAVKRKVSRIRFRQLQEAGLADYTPAAKKAKEKAAAEAAAATEAASPANTAALVARIDALESALADATSVQTAAETGKPASK